MRFYVAGPMRGYPQYNFPAFDAACKRIRDAGHVAIGPQELDRLFGFNEHHHGYFPITAADMRRYMQRDLGVIINEVDSIAVLNGWEKSRGAMAEVHLARALGIPIYDEFLNPLRLHIEIHSETSEGV